jgi:DNA-binding GntR family transcriptional regulator
MILLRSSDRTDAGPGAAATPEGGLDGLSPLGRRKSASELAYEQLREAVISLALPPGTVLARGAIAQRLGLSQTPVREALIRLQEERLVEVVPHSATRVSKIDLANAREAHFLRLAIELEIVRRLAQAPSPALAGMLQAGIARMRAGLAADDHAGLASADEAFHAALYVAAGVPGLRDLVHGRSGHLDRLRRLHLPAPGKAEAILGDHEELAAAILAGDAMRAEARLRQHLAGTFAEADRLRAASPDFFS